MERDEVGLARSAGSDQAIGVDHRVLRAELSKLGIAQALALAAQDHADRQLRSTVGRMHHAGLTDIEIAQLTGARVADVVQFIGESDVKAVGMTAGAAVDERPFR